MQGRIYRDSQSSHVASSAGNSVCPSTGSLCSVLAGGRVRKIWGVFFSPFLFPETRPRNPPAHTLHREPVLITELCDTDVTEITELPGEEASSHATIGRKVSSTPVKLFRTATVVSIINIIFKNTPVTYFMQHLSQRKHSQEKRFSE